MTVIHGVEVVDDVRYIQSETRAALMNNDPIEEHLHVVMVVSNPCQFSRRFTLAREFIARMENEPNVKLYIAELASPGHAFHVTEAGNGMHRQLRAEFFPLWEKECLINIAVRTLLPPDWKAVAWIDADVEFESGTWATDTLKILNGSRDVVQLFSHAVDMDRDENAMSVFSGFGFQYSKKRTYTRKGGAWHPGYAWACTRKAYERMGGLYENGILGAGDHNMSMALVGKARESLNPQVHPSYLKDLLDYERRVGTLRLGYVPGVIRHYFHGSKKNRQYNDRWRLLVKYQYDPNEFITKNADGVLVPSARCPAELLSEIRDYFFARHEDD